MKEIPSIFTGTPGNISVHSRSGKPQHLPDGPGGMQMELRNALQTAVKKKTHVLIEALPVRTESGVHPVDIIVRPFTDPKPPRTC